MSEEFYEEYNYKSSGIHDIYKNCKILKDLDTGDLLLSTREDIVIPKKPQDTYHRVASNESERLDIIANNYYKNPLLWWIIARANNIYDPLTPIPPGTLIRIPSLEALYGNRGVLL